MPATASSIAPTSQHGTTLVEQLMVVTIIAALLSVATPALTRIMARNQVQIAQTDLMAALYHARAMAVTQGKRTVLCPSTDANSCSMDTRWDHGWLWGHDNDHDDQPDAAPAYVHAGYARLSITSSTGRHYVRFQPDGSAGGSNLTLILCQPGQPEQTLSVVVSNSGRIRGATATPKQSQQCIEAL